MVTALVIIHVIIAVVLTVIVLMQHGRQQGLSGAIAGGAETFFGKNKGRTIDAMLRKFTAVFAILFIFSSIVLTYISIRQANIDEEANDAAAGDETSQTMNVTMDESGNLVDESGNIVMSAEDMAAQEAAADEDAAAEDAAAEDATAGDAAAEDATADDAAAADEGAAADAAGAVDQSTGAAQDAAAE